jgi:DNA-binding NtrC family response regulator
MKPAVLLVDDEPSLCELLGVFFEKKGYAPRSAHSVKDGLRLLEGPEPVMAMVDLSLGQESGLTLVKALIGRWPRLPVVVMTAYGTVEKAVEAVKLGAFDFISKPFEMGFLAKVVEKAVGPRALEKENRELKEALRRQSVELVGASRVIRDLKGRIEAIAPSDSTALITGESGTGKELVAKLIHQLSLRAANPFVPVNCSALSENLLESELFGHVKGAFTSAFADKEGLFAVANGGTILLDEIGEMPLRTQVKLLRVLQEREITPVGGTASERINVRILAATNVNLEEAVAKGRFREDLYYRLNVLRVHTPSLSEREEDAVVLANHFLDRKTRGRKRFSQQALAQILAYSWPGNVRQLENAVERAIAFNQGTVIEALELDMPSAPERVAPGPAPEEGYGPEAPGKGKENAGEAAVAAGGVPGPLTGEAAPTLVDIEKAYIYWVLSQNAWHKATAARILGLDISTLYRKIERYGLKAPS